MYEINLRNHLNVVRAFGINVTDGHFQMFGLANFRVFDFDYMANFSSVYQENRIKTANNHRRKMRLRSNISETHCYFRNRGIDLGASGFSDFFPVRLPRDAPTPPARHLCNKIRALTHASTVYIIMMTSAYYPRLGSPNARFLRTGLRPPM